MLKNNELGRSMIEMLGVLAIVGVLSVGGVAGYSKAMTKFKLNKTIEQISTIIANVENLFAHQRNYRGLDLDVAVNAKIIPDEMITDDGVVNSFGGSVSIFASKTDDDENGAYVVAFSGIPASECAFFGLNNFVGENVIAFSYGLLGSDDDDDDEHGECDTSDFDLNEITESSEPLEGSCCLFYSPGHDGCDYPSGIYGVASAEFNDFCTIAWKFM